MLFAKSGLELLLISVFGDDNQFIYPLTWVLVLALIFTAVLQVTQSPSPSFALLSLNQLIMAVC